MSKKSLADMTSDEKYALWRDKCVSDPIYFREQVILDDRDNSPIRMEPLHIEWLKHIDRCKKAKKHCAILAPWGHGKTVQVAIAESLWMIGKNPNIRIKIVNCLDDFSMDRVRVITRYIETNEKYRAIFPAVVKDESQQWTDHRIYVKRNGNAIDPTLEAKGIFSTGISGRADVIIFDDPVDNRSIYSEKVRDSAREAYRNTWMSRLVDDGFVLYIATRWSDEDLTKTIMESGRYLTLIQRVSDDFERIEQEIL